MRIDSWGLSLIELLVCVALLSFMIASIALPQLYGLRSLSAVTELQLITRAQDNLRADLAVVDSQAAWLAAWQQDLQGKVPGLIVENWRATQQAVSLRLTWPSMPGLVALGPGHKNSLTRTLFF